MNDHLNYKALAIVCEKACLFDMAVKNRVDFFELLRCNDVEEYNRENPLWQLSKGMYDLFKEFANEVRQVKGN